MMLNMSEALNRKIERREDDHLRIAEMAIKDIEKDMTKPASVIIRYLRIAYMTGIQDAKNNP